MFDMETDSGKDMTLYNDLLNKAVSSLSRTFQKKAISELLSGRGGKLVEQDKQVSRTTDFELITWLVIL